MHDLEGWINPGNRDEDPGMQEFSPALGAALLGHAHQKDLNYRPRVLTPCHKMGRENMSGSRAS